MAGLAKTNNFMLATAEVMIGPMADLRKLNPTEHGIGLVKNFSITPEPNYTELQQGLQGTIVESVRTSNVVRATMEVFEYTAENLAYGLGLEGDYTKHTVNSTVDGSVSSGSTFDVATGDGSNFTAGDYVMIINDNNADFVIAKITNVATDTLTVQDAFTRTINDGAVVKKVHGLDIGQKSNQPYYAAKITGKLTDGSQVVMEIPKFRIVNGFAVAFSTDDFANMPFEMTLYDLVSTDDFYAEYALSDSPLAKMYVQ